MDNFLDLTLPKELREVVKYQGIQSLSASLNRSVASEDGSKHAGEFVDPTKKAKDNVVSQEVKMDEKSVAKVVKDILDEKDAEQQITAKITTLETEKSELATANEAAQESVKDLTSKLESAQAELEEKNTQIETLTKEKDEAVASLEERDEKIQSLEMEKAKAERKEILADKGILFADAEKQEKQLEKTKAMSDEAFEDYVSELSDMKAQASSEDDGDSDGEAAADADADASDGDADADADAAADKTEADADADADDADADDKEGDDEGGDEGEDKANASKKDVPDVADVSDGEKMRQTVAAIAGGSAKADPERVELYSQM